MNDPKKVAKKGIIGAVASGAALTVVSVVRIYGDRLGLPEEVSAVVTGWVGDTVTALATGALLALSNWVKHRST